MKQLPTLAKEHARVRSWSGTLRFVRSVIMTLSVWLLACGEPPQAKRASQELTVYAAASLREAFTELVAAFQQVRPNARVQLNFAGSQELRLQIEHGAQADVFASADRAHMESLEQAGHVERAWHFTSNEPVLVVARDAAAQIQRLSDLPRAERIVFGVEEVPIGRYTAQILERAGTVWGADFRSRVEARVVSRELNVRQVLAKVRLQEAQAGIVYATDARAVTDVQVVRIPEQINVVAEYPIARLKRARNPELAQAFVDFVRGDTGQATLERAGFLPFREH